MEIDITDFITTTDTWPFSGSVLTHGVNASRTTWNAAREQAAREPLLSTEEQLDAMRRFARASGGWTKDEIAAWDAIELNALFIQWIAGDMRESGMSDCDIEDFDWGQYEADVAEGRISGNIYRGDIEGDPAFGRIFFSLGC